MVELEYVGRGKYVIEGYYPGDIIVSDEEAKDLTKTPDVYRIKEVIKSPVIAKVERIEESFEVEIDEPLDMKKDGED